MATASNVESPLNERDVVRIEKRRLANQAKACTTFEPYVAAEPVAQLLSIKPRRVLEMARSGELPAHPIGKGRRRTWRFRLSEIDGIF
jgi:hypothetical protein